MSNYQPELPSSEVPQEIMRTMDTEVEMFKNVIDSKEQPEEYSTNLIKRVIQYQQIPTGYVSVKNSKPLCEIIPDLRVSEGI